MPARRLSGSSWLAAIAIGVSWLAAPAQAADDDTPKPIRLAAGDELGWQLFGDLAGARATPARLDSDAAAEPSRAEQDRLADELIRWLLDTGEREARWNAQP